VGVIRDALSEGILGRFISRTDKNPRNYYFDGAGQRRRLKSWLPTQYTTNVIMSATGTLLRSRARDAMRNNPHANAACEAFVANLIGTGIKPSSLLVDKPELRAEVMELWLDWTDDADADGLADFYGLQTIVARALFEAGECFIRFRNRKPEDGFGVPLQVQLLESEMCPYWWNQYAPNGNWIMNGVELDFIGRRAAYWFFPTHPGDMTIDLTSTLIPVRIPASEILHIFKPTRPGQMRGVPIITPALVRMFFLDQQDDAELERKRIASMFAGFITTATPEDIIPIDGLDDSAPQQGIGLSGLEPGTMQTLLPGEDIKFSEPADVGGSYEAFQYRQQLALYGALGIPYTVATSDLRRANYSSLRGSIVEFRRKLEQLQHQVIVFQMCAPIWRRWLDTAVLAQALPIDASTYLAAQADYQRAKWIPQRNDWVDPLKDRQAEKLAVDAGFKSRSDVVEAEGSDPEESDQRIAADKEREEELGLEFPVLYASATQPGGDQAAADQAASDAQDAADQAAQEQADEAA
jgi:lambda family phage portal protein